MNFRILSMLAAFALVAFSSGCATHSTHPMAAKTPLPTVSHVNLSRYMGDWRVIANIPYFAEKGCVDSIESYRLLPDGTIDNGFTYRKKSFIAPQKHLKARAYVVNRSTNAEWKVKFLGGLISARYLIIDLDPDYAWTVVGHPSRNYGWIMARERTLSTATYQHILQRLAALGVRSRPLPKSPAASWKINRQNLHALGLLRPVAAFSTQPASYKGAVRILSCFPINLSNTELNQYMQ
ncbi:MAG: lipocalin family protein, partial [Chthoniobacteraceae bacterium]